MAREDDAADALIRALALPPDDDLAAASAASRTRRRWLRQQATESATFAGVLLAVAEGDRPVTLHAGPWTHTGRLRTVTEALCIMEVADGDVALLPTDAITVVESPAEMADDRVPAGGVDLAGVLATLVGEKPPVRLLLADGTEVTGTLTGVGTNTATVRLTPSVATVRLSAIDGCVLPARGNTSRPGIPSGR